MGTDFKILLGKQNKNEIQLPTLYFVSMNQWLEVIGDIAFMSWLKLYTWSKQENVIYSTLEFNDINSLSLSFSAIAKKLGVANDTLENKILKPLWNVGLIDIIEKDKNKINTQEILIMVYRYPQNRIENSFKPIENFRDYEKDYTKNNRVFHKYKSQNVNSNSIVDKDTFLLNVLDRHKERLTSDQIDVKIIIDLWREEQGKIDKMVYWIKNLQI